MARMSNGWRSLILGLLLLLVTAALVPQMAGAEPNLKATHECVDPLNGVGGDVNSAIGGLRANTETSCKVAVKAIHHGHLSRRGFRTKHWTCKRQGGIGPEEEGERVKCRRGAKEAFEFTWATRGG
jgi:hypothetical protein